MALLTLAPVAAIALSPAAAGVETRTSNLSLADLDLSTPAGVDAARDRLQQTARRWCSQVADRQDLSHQPNFIACMDETLAAALRQINGPVRAAIEEPGEWHTQQADATHSRLPPTVPETRVMIVSLANLNHQGPVVLIVLRGYPGYQCPYCTRQVHDFPTSASAVELSCGSTRMRILNCYAACI